jgi:hypothetical protein
MLCQTLWAFPLALLGAKGPQVGKFVEPTLTYNRLAVVA